MSSTTQFWPGFLINPLLFWNGATALAGYFLGHGPNLTLKLLQRHLLRLVHEHLKLKNQWWPLTLTTNLPHIQMQYDLNWMGFYLLIHSTTTRERMLHLEDHLLHHVLGDEDRRKVSGSGMIIFVCRENDCPSTSSTCICDHEKEVTNILRMLSIFLVFALHWCQIKL